MRCCQDMAPRGGCSVCVQGLLAFLWANLLGFPLRDNSFLMAQVGPGLGASILLQSQPMTEQSPSGTWGRGLGVIVVVLVEPDVLGGLSQP